MAKNHMTRLGAGFALIPANVAGPGGALKAGVGQPCRNFKDGRMTWRIGIDIGGTFTDVAMVEEATGRIGVAKVLTTPKDFGQGVIAGLRSGIPDNAIEPA